MVLLHLLLAVGDEKLVREDIEDFRLVPKVAIELEQPAGSFVGLERMSRFFVQDALLWDGQFGSVLDVRFDHGRPPELLELALQSQLAFCEVKDLLAQGFIDHFVEPHEESLLELCLHLDEALQLADVVENVR